MDIVAHLFSRSRSDIVLAITVGILSGLGNAVLIGLINAALYSSTPSGLGPGPLIYGGLGFVVVLTHIISTIMVMRAGQTAARDLRMDLSRRIIGAPLRLLQKLGTPRLLANLTEDIPVMVNAFQLVPHVCINSAWVLGCLIYLGWLSWSLFLLMISTIILGVGIYWLSTMKAMAPLRAAREQDDALYAHFRALILGIKEIKLHHRRRDAFLTDVLYPTAEACRQGNISAMTVFILASIWGSAVLYFIIGVILFEASGWEGITKEIVSGYTLTVLYMMAPLTGVINGLPALGRASIALGKIDHLKKELVDQMEGMNMAGPPMTPTSPGIIELIQVTHRYGREGKGNDFTLGPLNVALQPGELIFFTGGNGSGKSTLGLLLVGLYSPEGGQIMLNGEIIDDTNRDIYRQQFSAVFSDFYLFQSLLGLVQENLDKKAHVRLAELQLDRKVAIVDGVFSTVDLSQGQRKRLALLTAYLEDRPFYVFDEWAADQDPIFKELFYTVILTDLKARGKTIVVITHDDHYFHVADRCIKLEDGHIVESKRAEPDQVRTDHSGMGNTSIQTL